MDSSWPHMKDAERVSHARESAESADKRTMPPPFCLSVFFSEAVSVEVSLSVSLPPPPNPSHEAPSASVCGFIGVCRGVVWSSVCLCLAGPASWSVSLSDTRPDPCVSLIRFAPLPLCVSEREEGVMHTD